MLFSTFKFLFYIKGELSIVFGASSSESALRQFVLPIDKFMSEARAHQTSPAMASPLVRVPAGRAKLDQEKRS
jgi:hypothetical protein